MKVDPIETATDAYGWPTEASRARQELKRQHRTATVREERRPGSTPAYAIWEFRRGHAIRLSRDMPDEATAWINANSQLDTRIDPK
jgi:hypothetical protein